MLRFVPDSWIEVLLRPILLADPVAGLYAEIHAPDWRYLMAALFLLIGTLLRRRQPQLDGAQWRSVIGLALCFYLWTLVSGNGRYFFWGLLMAGPLVVVAARQLPATRSMRNTVVVSVVGLQAWVVGMTYEPNVWMLRPWGDGPGVARSTHALAGSPAVFLTVGSISHSILVPLMHPESRWANVGGQQDLRPGMREFDQLQALLASPLPKFGVIRAARLVMTDDRQPTEAAWTVIRRALAIQGFAPAPKPCAFLRLEMGGPPFELQTPTASERGFWFCELNPIPQTAAASPDSLGRAPEFDDVFAQIERRCPRYFPAGNALTRPADDGVSRHYSHSDTSVAISQTGVVYFKNMRALNPTELGRVDDIRAGRFRLDCDRLPGRYRPPWERGWGVDLE